MPSKIDYLANKYGVPRDLVLELASLGKNAIDADLTQGSDSTIAKAIRPSFDDSVGESTLDLSYGHETISEQSSEGSGQLPLVQGDNRTIDFELFSQEQTEEIDIPLRIERYSRRGLLGKGGMGEVHRVWDSHLERYLAMKLLLDKDSPSEQSAFRREAQITAQLQNPGIVPIHDLGKNVDGESFFTMKEIQGSELQDVIQSVHDISNSGSWAKTVDGWSLRRLIVSFYTICQTMAYSHKQGIIHCDLKPSNIMVGSFNEVLIVDWGIARRQSESHSGGIYGSPSYMAPEQARGERITILSDIYSLGGILYQILNCEAPITSPNIFQTLRIVQSESPELIMEWKAQLENDVKRIENKNGLNVPTDLIKICTKAMGFAPEERYQSSSEMVKDILSWLDGSRDLQRALNCIENAKKAAAIAEQLEIKGTEKGKDAEIALSQIPPWANTREKKTILAKTRRGSTSAR
jgi:eukaryotic-like serine/threonine-protein kinase